MAWVHFFEQCLFITLDIVQLVILQRRHYASTTLVAFCSVDETLYASSHSQIKRACCVLMLGPLEAMPDYNRVRGAMYWLRLWAHTPFALCTDAPQQILQLSLSWCTCRMTVVNVNVVLNWSFRLFHHHGVRHLGLIRNSDMKQLRRWNKFPVHYTKQNKPHKLYL